MTKNTGALLIIFCHVNIITTVFGTFTVTCDLECYFYQLLTPTGQHKYDLQVWRFCT